VPGGFGRFLTPFLLFVLGLLAILYLTGINSTTVDLDTSKFLELLNAGKIESIVRTGSDIECTMGGKGVDQTVDGRKYTKFRLHMSEEEWAQNYSNEVKKAYEEGHLKSYTSAEPSKWPEIIMQIAIFGGAILLIWFLFFRRLSGSGAGGIAWFGKAKAQLIPKGQIKNTFDDVAGIDEAKEEVQEIISFLKCPDKFKSLGGRIPHGVLLIGPPGTGKTLLAKAIAGEADVPFYAISGSDFVELFVGVGASRVRDLFGQAKASAPCIIFLDEIDAVGRRRGPATSSGGVEEREQTLNAILVEMQGLSSNENVIVIAATNRPDMLDPALLRPGRFDRRVFVDLPDVKGREAILKIHARVITMAPDVDLMVIARSTPTFSGAELESLLNEAALIAVRKDKKAVEMSDVEEARDKVRFGRELKSRQMSEEDRKRTAFHEAGHALVTALSPEADPLHKVSIIPRGRSLGSTLMLPTKDELQLTSGKAQAIITTLLAGRATEKRFLGDWSTGASNDIERATELARRMVTEWGMSERLGPVNYSKEEYVLGLDEGGATNRVSAKTAEIIDEEITRIIREAEHRVNEFVVAYATVIERIAIELCEKETLTAEEVAHIVRDTAAKNGFSAPAVNISGQPGEAD